MSLVSENFPYQDNVKNNSIYQSLKATAPVNTCIQEFWQLNVPQGTYNYRSVPDNCVDMIINLTAPEEVFVVTPFSSVKEFEMVGPVSYFGIRFRTLAHQGLFTTPMGEWNNAANVINVDELLPEHALTVIFGGASKLMSFKSRCEFFSKALLCSPSFYQTDKRLLRFIQYCNQNISSSIVLSDAKCAKFGLSARQLRRLTSQYLGLSPIKFAKVIRFQQTLRIMRKGGSSPIWTNCYYDQSHFIREFKSMSGVTPSEFPYLSALYNTD